MQVEDNGPMKIDLSNKCEIEKWCELFDCSEETLRYCVTYAGKSIVSIESFLTMNRDWIERRNELI